MHDNVSDCFRVSGVVETKKTNMAQKISTREYQWCECRSGFEWIVGSGIYLYGVADGVGWTATCDGCEW